VRSFLLSGLFAAVTLLSGCGAFVSWDSTVASALQLPPEECEQKINDKETADHAWGSAMPTSTYDKGRALCNKERDKVSYEFWTKEAGKSHQRDEEAGYSGSRNKGLSLETITSLYTTGAVMGSAINNSDSSSAVQNAATVTTTNSAPSTAAYSSSGPPPTFIPGVPSNSAGPTTTVATSNNGSSRPEGNTTTLKGYRSASACVRRDSKSNSLGDFWVNECSFTVMVNWIDGESCRRGCGAGPIPPGRKESTTKAGGPYRVAACEYPGVVRSDSNTEWTGDAGYRCLGP
jgi:hypothetical protein